VVAGLGRSRCRRSTPVVADLSPSGNGEEADLAAASCVDEEANLVRVSCIIELQSRPGRHASSSCGVGRGVVHCRVADPAGASCVVEVRTWPGRRAPSRGGPGRGVIEEAPAAASARVSDGYEERERPRGEGENEWVGGISGISYPAPVLCACGG
jgi:hypothetical protein